LNAVARNEPIADTPTVLSFSTCAAAWGGGVPAVHSAVICALIELSVLPDRIES
jgi:hypothetical protein